MNAGQAPEGAYSSGRRAAAWGVHLLTASGAVVGVMALLASGQGDFQAVCLWMLLALVIDAVDGSFARAADVSKVVPGTDGRTLDDVIDFLNYVIVPAVFLVQAGLVPHWGFIVPPVLASAYGFSQTDAKTDDHFFLGFPSYWNVVAIYAWLLALPPVVLSGILMLLAIAVFVPIKYVYPSRTRQLRRTTNSAAVLWTLALAAALVWPEPGRPLVEVSLLFPAYYLGLSLWVGGLARRG